MNGRSIGNNSLPPEVSSIAKPVLQNNIPTTHAIFSLARSPLVTSFPPSSSTILLNTPTNALTPMYETSFAIPGCVHNDKLGCTATHTSKTAIPAVARVGQEDCLQRAAILTPVAKPSNGTVLVTTFPAPASSAAGELDNNSGLLESHLLQMTPILPLSTVSTTSTPTPSIEMMDWSAQHTSKTVLLIKCTFALASEMLRTLIIANKTCFHLFKN